MDGTGVMVPQASQQAGTIVESVEQIENCLFHPMCSMYALLQRVSNSRELSISSSTYHLHTVAESVYHRQRFLYFMQCIACTHYCRECLPQIGTSLFHAVHIIYTLLQRVSTTDRDFSISSHVQHVCTIVDSVKDRYQIETSRFHPVCSLYALLRSAYCICVIIYREGLLHFI